MKRKRILLFLIFCLSTNLLFANDLCKIKFEVVKNKIVLKVPTKSGHQLNLIFDSGANEFLLDSVTARNLLLTTDSSRTSATNFINGAVKSKFFFNNGLFADSILNAVYKRGSSINLSTWSAKYGIHIDGLIGINNYFKMLSVSINFKRAEFKIGNEDYNYLNTKGAETLSMIFTDGGHEIYKNSGFHSLTATKVKVTASPNHIIETNAEFDTGFNQDFLLLTIENLDSLAKSQNIGLRESKKVSLGSHDVAIYEFNADSVTLDQKISVTNVKMQCSATSKVVMSAFGSLKTACLIGIGFLRKYEEVYFNYRGKTIILIN